MDGFGVAGLCFVGASIIATSLSAFFAFIYFWRKNRLDLDEDAKYRMMEDEHE